MSFQFNRNTCLHTTLFFLALAALFACKKFVQIQPPSTSLSGDEVYSNNATAAEAVSAIYLSMGGTNGAGRTIGGNKYGLSAILGLCSDEFTLFTTSDQILKQAYANAYLSKNPPAIWSDLYNNIYQANSAIAGITASNGVTPSMKNQLIGESKFIRALCYFYLVNIYGDVPLVAGTDYSGNALLPRQPQTIIYQQIVGDLHDAESLLTTSYLNPAGSTTTERVRPNKIAASALLARTYLYLNKWDSAQIEASAVISNSNYQLLSNLTGVFLANSGEAIWQLEMPNNGFNTPDAQVFLLSYYKGPTSTAPFILSDTLVNRFEPGDKRRTSWIDSVTKSGKKYHFVSKYKLNYTGLAPAEFPTILRLAEQYLIRAEARAQLNDLSNAANDLNLIRTRAGLPNTTATTQTDLINSIINERRFELFTEYGHRWLDLKRLNKLDSVMTIATPRKGGSWKSTSSLYPIPLTDMQRDPNLTQNPGYN